jgi:hypothetical protein
MDMVLMLISSICLLGIVAFTIMIELENIKKEKRARERKAGAWTLSEEKAHMSKKTLIK